MFNNSGFANNALNSRTIQADEIYTDSLTATTTTSTIQDFTNLTTDEVNEKTGGAGVTVDGVLLKDGLVDAVDVSALKTNVDGFLDGLKTLTADEISQLANIGTSIVSATQWGYLGATDQGLATTDNVTFNSISVVGTVDGVDVLALKTQVDNIPIYNQSLNTTDGVTFNTVNGKNIDNIQSFDQSLNTTNSPQFNDLTLQGGGDSLLQFRATNSSFNIGASENTNNYLYIDDVNSLRLFDYDEGIKMNADEILFNPSNANDIGLRLYTNANGAYIQTGYDVDSLNIELTLSKIFGTNMDNLYCTNQTTVNGILTRIKRVYKLSFSL